MYIVMLELEVEAKPAQYYEHASPQWQRQKYLEVILQVVSDK